MLSAVVLLLQLPHSCRVTSTCTSPHLARTFTVLLMLLVPGGGGFIPARILRTFLKQEHGKTIPIQVGIFKLLYWPVQQPADLASWPDVADSIIHLLFKVAIMERYQ